jgi:hypothetical protein
LVPTRSLSELVAQHAKRRRRRRLGEHAHATRRDRLDHQGERVADLIHRRTLPLVERVLRAIGIEQVKDRRLRERADAGVARRARHDAAAVERVLGVAVEVDRPSFIRRRDQRVRHPAELERGRVLQRLARRLVLGPARERDDLFLLVALTARRDGAEAGEAHARAHQVEEVAARQRVDRRRLVGAGRELLAARCDLPRCLARELAERSPVAMLERRRQRSRRRLVVRVRVRLVMGMTVVVVVPMVGRVVVVARRHCRL